MSLTFLQLQKSCARLLGANDPTQLGDEADDVRSWINEAYRSCYNPADGSFPKWAKKPFSVYFPGPFSITFTATEGSDVMDGLAEGDFDKSLIGARFKVSEQQFYTYAGWDATAGKHKMVEMWALPTGSVTPTVYASVRTLDFAIMHVYGEPETLGYGPLYPLDGAEGEVQRRIKWNNADFYTVLGAPVGLLQRPLISSNWETGKPFYYYVDHARMPYGFGIYPLPDQDYTVKFYADVMPKELAADGDIPVLPADVVGDILLPIARFKTASQSKRFSGANIRGLQGAHDAALARLKALAAPQIETGGVIRPARYF